jgi:hypothetical protein
MSSIHPVLAAVTDRITERSSSAAYPQQTREADTVDPRGRLTCANLAAQFLVSLGSTPTLLDAISANPERSAQCLARMVPRRCGPAVRVDNSSPRWPAEVIGQAKGILLGRVHRGLLTRFRSAVDLRSAYAYRPRGRAGCRLPRELIRLAETGVVRW